MNITEKSLIKALQRFPLDAIVTYKNQEQGKVIGYKRANETGDIEIIYLANSKFAIHPIRQFSLRARYYGIKS